MQKRILRILFPVLFISILNLSLVAQTNGEIDFTPKPIELADVDQEIISLNGEWGFASNLSQRFFKKPTTRGVDWKTISVPGEWLMQGFEVKPGTKAAYAKSIDLPVDWENHEVILKCDAVYSLAEVFVNGKLVGKHEGGLTPFELTLTDFVKMGRSNQLIVTVQNESMADTLSSTSQYAAHQLGGITRKIELFAVPNTHITKLHLETELDENFENALLSAKFNLKPSVRDKASKFKVRMILRSSESGEVIQDKITDINLSDLAGQGDLKITMPVLKPTLWDPEHPYLYDVFVILEKDGALTEKLHDKIGFREINVAGNQVFVNGRPIKLRGVNRHEVHPTKGRSLSIQEWRADAKLFKEANVNYIRTSHYPPGEEFIELCDSIGLFVEMEAPMCWIGHHANARWISDDPHAGKFVEIIRQQALETVAHYRNHPSVIIWSMANESAWGPTWEGVLTEINKADPSRPVSFHDQSYGGFNNYGSTHTQIANIHYPGPNGPDAARKYDRPLLFGEYAHLNTYNRQEIVTDPGVRDAWGRGLESMWEDMYHSAGCLGGAIWSGIDDVFYLPNGTAVGYGEWGPIDGWRRPKPEYYHLKKIYSPIKIVDRSIAAPALGEPILVPVENRQLFTNMNEVEIEWTIGNSKGKASMDLGPRQTGLLKIWADKGITANDQLELVFISQQGYVIDQYVIDMECDEEVVEDGLQNLIKPQLMVLERRATVVHGDTEWTFDATTGKIQSVRKNNKQVIVRGPELFMIPLKTGPCNTEHSLLIEPYNDPCENWNGKISATGKDGNSVFIEVSGSYKEADLTLRYIFDSTAQVKIDYTIISKEDINPRQIGLIFKMPKEFDQLSWKRTGQWSSYPENHIGRTTGTATPFPNGMLETEKFGDSPDWAWEEDTHAMGSNDFRATRDKLNNASLQDKTGSGVRMHSDGSGAFRAYVDGNNICFLGASFSTAGGDMFFSSHLAGERQPLKKGEVRKARMVIEIL